MAEWQSQSGIWLVSLNDPDLCAGALDTQHWLLLLWVSSFCTTRCITVQPRASDVTNIYAAALTGHPGADRKADDGEGKRLQNKPTTQQKGK